MSDSHANWWMDASCRWHQGAPPPDWWQARDGRWRPPAADDTTEELTASPPVGGAHLASRGPGANLWQTYRAWPRWARLAGPIVASLLVIAVLGAAATEGLRDGDRETTATDRATTTEPATTTTSPNAVTPAPTAGATATPSSVPVATTDRHQPDTAPTTVTTGSPRPPTTADPPTNDIRPAAPCSPEGATAVTADGTPMVCTLQKCHGAPFSEPRWRRASC